MAGGLSAAEKAHRMPQLAAALQRAMTNLTL